MRIAFVGKGGSGKSAIAGTLARLLARHGEPVLVLDSDPMPGLALSLGMDASDAGIPDEAIEENPDAQAPRFRLRAGLTAAEAVERYAAVGPDGVRLLQMGKLRGHVSAVARSQFAFRQITRELEDGAWHLVGDLPGGTRQPYFGWGRFARTVLVVAEPTAKSLLSARRLAGLAGGEDPPRVLALANKVREPADADHVAARTGLEVVAAVPWDEELAEAERAGRAPVDHAPRSAAVRVVEQLVDLLRTEEDGAAG
ncbi:MAG TPA: ArsA-related P-loop ATPase [Nitriliruptorales bacterium]|nr:ArsA-related P-loop ATPase [Nitriliruptorales bacterium]